MKKPTTKKLADSSKKVAKAKPKKAAVAKKPATAKKTVEKKREVGAVKTKAISAVVAEVAKPVKKAVVRPVEKEPRRAVQATVSHKVEPVEAPVARPKTKVVAGICGVGRRKSAVARVWLTRGHGVLVINGRDYEAYFDTPKTRLSVTEPLRAVSDASRYDANVNVQGGGLPAQADAVKLGFARALLTLNSDLRPALRRAGLLTVDSRVKERKKYGRRAARRRFQFVKR